MATTSNNLPTSTASAAAPTPTTTTTTTTRPFAPATTTTRPFAPATTTTAASTAKSPSRPQTHHPAPFPLYHYYASPNIQIRPQTQNQTKSQISNPISSSQQQQGILYPVASSGRGFIPRPVRPLDQTVTVANNPTLTPGAYHTRALGVAYRPPIGSGSASGTSAGSPRSHPHLDSGLVHIPHPSFHHPVPVIKQHPPHLQHQQQHYVGGSACAGLAPIKGIPVAGQLKAVSSPLPISDSNVYKSLRDRSRDDTFTIIRDRKDHQTKDPSLRKEQQQMLCEECREIPSKYRCPGCSLRSCSLPCVKAHKQRTGCSGKRVQTQFVPLSQFNDNILLSDYNLLEDMKRVAESAEKMRKKLGAYPQFRLPAHLRSLKGAAAGRKTKLLFLPSGMSKRAKNQSRYNQRKKFISWTIEWRFHATNVILFDHGVHEDTPLCSVIENHLKPGPWNHQLRQFCEEHVDSLKFFIRKYPKGAKSPFCELDIKASLRQQLASVVLLEYPVIYVFHPSHSYDFEVVKGVNAVSYRPESKNSVLNDPPSPKGVVFREEEIEENNDNSNSQVYDFLKNVILSPLHEFPDHNISEKTLYEQPNELARETAGNIPQCNSQTMEPGIFEDMEFDFDQELMDAYSDLIGQVNPDDFLDLEGEFPEDEKLEERKDLLNSMGVLLVQEELEEGEIVE